MKERKPVLSVARMEHLIGSAVEQALRDGKVRSKNDPTRVNTLRISGLPFCPLQWFLSLPRASSTSTVSDTSSSYFTRVGTAVHDVIQQALVSLLDQELESAPQVELIADWHCGSCKHVHSRQVRPAACEQCGHSQLIFDEVSIRTKGHSGHIDTVFQVSGLPKSEDFPEGKIWLVIDYKTTMLKRVMSKNSGLPYSDNVFQIRGYVASLKMANHPVFPAGFLVYVPRDNPFKFQIKTVEVDFQREIRRLKSYEKWYEYVSTISTQEEVEELVKVRPCRECVRVEHSECKWAPTCAGEEQSGTIRTEAIAVYGRVRSKLPIRK